MVRSILVDSELAKSFWAEVLVTATYLRNPSPTKAVEGKPPFEAIYGVNSQEFLVVLPTHIFHKTKDRS